MKKCIATIDPIVVVVELFVAIFRQLLVSMLTVLWGIATVVADEPVVEAVTVEHLAHKTYRFSVTVAHGDQGWNHYANRWVVEGPDGALLGTRVLAHPHVNEQPFTRSMQAEIPDGVQQVFVRAHDSVHGDGGAYLVKIPGR